MGRRWDYSVPSALLWSEVERVLKPGAHAMIFGGSRTFHRTVVAAEDGGLIPRDLMFWIYGSGYPKSHNASKAIEKLEGEEEAEDWIGFGTALKPSYEPILLARKMLDGTVAENALKWGSGALAIDVSRIGSDEPFVAPAGNTGKTAASFAPVNVTGYEGQTVVGRWPSNIIIDEVTGKVLDVMFGDHPGMSGGGKHRKDYAGGMFGGIDSEGTARNDNGGVSRFFKTTEPDDLGSELFHAAKAILAEWLPSNVSTAERRSTLSRERVGSALKAVVARASSERVTVTSTSGLFTSVTVSEFETLCESAIALILTSERKCWPELLQGKHTLSRSLASAAVALEQTGITTITTSLSTSDGSVVAVTFENTQRSVEVGEADSRSRVFYTTKADRYQREAGLEKMKKVPKGVGALRDGGRTATTSANTHPTVKPIDLIRYLAALILPPKRSTPRRILVPFSGVASEMIGCMQAGWDEVVGIEREAEYIAIAKARITGGGVLSGLMDKKMRRRKAR